LEVYQKIFINSVVAVAVNHWMLLAVQSSVSMIPWKWAVCHHSIVAPRTASRGVCFKMRRVVVVDSWQWVALQLWVVQGLKTPHHRNLTCYKKRKGWSGSE